MNTFVSDVLVKGGQVVSFIKGVSEKFLKTLDFAAQEMQPLDAAMVDLARKAGLSYGQFANYAKQLAGVSNAIYEDSLTFAQRYGRDSSQYVTMVNEYQNAVGRNIALSKEQVGYLTALDMVLGDTGKNMAKVFHEFGIDAKQTHDILSQMRIDVNNIGVRLDEVGKQMNENLSKIQMYTFDNAVQGFTKMAQRAAEVNINMSQALNFANKIQDISSAIKVGSQLQVLGGSFSQMSNPLEMFYEATSDVGALQERMINMFADLGKYNTETNQVEISRFNRKRIQVAASEMGISPEEMLEMVNTEAMKREIDKQLISSELNSEDKRYLRNIASIDGEGNAVVSINNEQKKVSELTSEEINYLRNVRTKDNTQSINEIAITVHKIEENTRGKEAAERGAGESIAGQKGVDGFKEFLGGSLQGLGNLVGLDGIGTFGKQLIDSITFDNMNDSGVFGKIAGGINNLLTKLENASSGLGEEDQNLVTNYIASLRNLLKTIEEGGANIEFVKSFVQFPKSSILQAFGVEVGKLYNAVSGKNSNSGNTASPHVEGGLLRPISENAMTLISNGGLTTNYYNSTSTKYDIGGGKTEVPIANGVNGGNLNGGGTVQTTIGPGEFVIKQDSVNKVGLQTLDYINQKGEVPTTIPNDTGTILKPSENIVSYYGSNTSTINTNFSGKVNIVGIPDIINISIDKSNNEESGEEIKKSILYAIRNALRRASGGKFEDNIYNKIADALTING